MLVTKRVFFSWSSDFLREIFESTKKKELPAVFLKKEDVTRRKKIKTSGKKWRPLAILRVPSLVKNENFKW